MKLFCQSCNNYTYLMVCRSVFKKAFGKEAVNDNDEEFVDPLPEKLRATVVLTISKFCFSVSFNCDFCQYWFFFSLEGINT